jgi:hypothetical protein
MLHTGQVLLFHRADLQLLQSHIAIHPSHQSLVDDQSSRRVLEGSAEPREDGMTLAMKATNRDTANADWVIYSVSLEMGLSWLTSHSRSAIHHVNKSPWMMV